MEIYSYITALLIWQLLGIGIEEIEFRLLWLIIGFSMCFTAIKFDKNDKKEKKK